MNGTFVANLLHGLLRVCAVAAVALSFFSNTLFAETYSYNGAQIEYTGAQVSEVDGDLLLVYKDTSQPHSLVLPGYAIARILVVGGGGAGGDYGNVGAGGTGGGGGAGGYVEQSGVLLTAGNYEIVVGAGGEARTSGTYAAGNSGGNSWVTNITTTAAVVPAAIGGGGGGLRCAGLPGGSGGGSSRYSAGTTYEGGAPVEGQGHAGGTAVKNIVNTAAGGGGAGGAGADTINTGAAGGIATNSNITGSEVWYAGGGGAGLKNANKNYGLGGGTTVTAQKGGAGDGEGTASTHSLNAVENTGGGGGGAGGTSAGFGGAGGSGIVVIRISWASASEQIEKPVAQDFVYDGGEQFVAVEVPGVVTLSGTKTAVNVGEYQTTATLDPGMRWADNTEDAVTVDWSITKKPVPAPTAKAGLVYDGSSQSAETTENPFLTDAYEFIDNPDGTPSVTSATDAGTYKFTVRINSNHKWVDDSTGDKTVEWSIARKPVPIPTTKTGLVYNGSNQIAETNENPFVYSAYDFIDNPGSTPEASSPSVTNAVNAGVYNFTVRLNSNHIWSGGDTADQTIPWEIAKVVVPLPSAEAFTNEFVYTGSPLTAMTAPDDAQYTLSGTSSATDVNVYEFSVDLKDPVNYEWESASYQFDKTWSITKAPNDITGFAIESWQLGDEESVPVSSASFGTVNYKWSANPDAVDSERFAFGAQKIASAGEYYLWATVPETSNYDGAEERIKFVVWASCEETFSDYVDIVVSNKTATARANYPVLLTLSEFAKNAASGEKNGFEYDRAGGAYELAFTAGDVILPYTNETWVTVAESQVWVLLPELAANGTTTVRMWWRRPDKSKPVPVVHHETVFANDAAKTKSQSERVNYETYKSLVNKEGVWQNYWLEHPAISLTTWDEGVTGAESYITDGRLATGSVVRTYLVLPRLDPTNEFPVVRGSYVAEFTQSALENVALIGEKRRIDFAIMGHSPNPDLSDGIVDENGRTNLTLSGRILLMNNDFTHGGTRQYPLVDYQAYRDADNYGFKKSDVPSFWNHNATDAATVSAFPNLKKEIYSTLYTKDYGRILWQLKDCRHGNLYPKTGSGTMGLVPNQNYLPWSDNSLHYDVASLHRTGAALATRATTSHVVMRNTTDACVYSGCFSNGVGTVYLDAVNGGTGRDPEGFKLVIEYAMQTIEGKEPTDENCKGEKYDDGWDYQTKLEGMWQTATVVPMIKENDNKFTALSPTNEVALNIQTGGTYENFYRLRATLNIRKPVRIRIRRTSVVPEALVESNYILLDNIIVSPPAQFAELVSCGRYDEEKFGKSTLGYEGAFTKPFPAFTDNEGVFGRAKAVWQTPPADGDAIISAVMHYRWRYLNQSVGEWKSVYLDPDDSLKSIEPLQFEKGAEGDIEYYFTGTMQATYFEYSDYSGCGVADPLGGWTEEKTRIETRNEPLTPLASGGTDWFVRLRNGQSDRALVKVSVQGHEGAQELTGEYPMELVDDYMWRALVPISTNVNGRCSFAFVGCDLQASGADEFVTNSVFWGVAAAGVTNDIPASGKLVVDGERVTFEIDHAAGFIEFKMSEKFMTFSAARAEYQPFNNWHDIAPRDDSKKFLMSGVETNSVNLVEMKTLSLNMADWNIYDTTNGNWRETFYLPDYSGDAKYPYEVLFASHDTPNGWSAKQVTFVPQSLSTYDPKKQDHETGMSAKLLGQGKGSLDYTRTSIDPPDGLDMIKFRARIGQSITHDAVAYDMATWANENYTFFAPATMSQACPTNGLSLGDMAVGGAISLFAYYIPYYGGYEFRVERRHKGASYIMSVRKWKNVAGAMTYDTLAVTTNDVSWAWTEKEEGEGDDDWRKKYFGFFISCENQNDGAVKIAGGISTSTATPSLNTPAEEFFGDMTYNGIVCTDSSSAYSYGYTGLAAKDCPAQFLLPVCFNERIYPKDGAASIFAANGAFKAKTLTLDEAGDEANFTACREGLAGGRQWAVPSKRLEIYQNGAINLQCYGLRTPTNLAQKAVVKLRPHGSDSEDDWETFAEVEISNYALADGYHERVVRRPGEWDVRFTTGGDAVDIVYDDLEMTQWNVDDIENLSYKEEDFAYTQGMVEKKGGANRLVLMPARADVSKPVSLRSPLLDGMGKISFRVGALAPEAEVWVQMATNNVEGNLTGSGGYNYSLKEAPAGQGAAYGEWITLEKFKVSDGTLTENSERSVYVGLHDNRSNPVKGVFRLLVPSNVVASAIAASTKAPDFKPDEAKMEIVSCTVWDEPGFCERSWRGWNLRGIGDEEDSESRMYLADLMTGGAGHGLSAALNNSLNDLVIAPGDSERAKSFYPAIVSPTFGDVGDKKPGIGSVSYKARLYSTASEPDLNNLPGRIVIYGSLDSTSDNWTPVCTNWIYSQTLTNFTWSAGDVSYRAVKFEITNPSGEKVSDAAEVARVVLDEVVVSEKIRPAVNFRYAMPFRMNLLNSEIIKDILSPNEQPIAGESWGVQAALSLEQLADEIDVERGFDVTLSYYPGTNVWGYLAWRDHAKEYKLTCVDSSNLVFRSVMDVPQSLVSPSATGGEVVQFMVNVKYWDRGGNEYTRRLDADNWQQPKWYYPVDHNRAYGGDTDPNRFSAYTIIDTVSPGRAWINEVNWNDGKDSKEKENDQFIELAVPSGVDLTNWRVFITEKNGKSANIYTLKRANSASKISSTATNGYSFYVIQSPNAQNSGSFKLVDGTLADGTWSQSGIPESSSMPSGRIRFNEPYQFELYRPSGVLEHQIVIQGTNEFANMPALAHYNSGLNLVKTLNALDDSTRRFYAGEECATLPGSGIFSSIGVVGGNKEGEPPPGGEGTWSNEMRLTPGAPNEGQIIPEGWFLVPNGTNVWIYASVLGEGIAQSIGGETNRSLLVVMPSSASTSIVYTVARYHEVAAITVNGVTNVAHGTPVLTDGELKYSFDIVEPKETMYINATAGYDNRLSTKWGLDLNDRYTPSIVNWLTNGWPDKNLDDVQIATYKGLSENSVETPLTLKSMYWLDMDPFYGDGGKSHLRLRGDISYGPVAYDFPLHTGLILTNQRVRLKIFIEDLDKNTTNRIARMRGLDDSVSDDPSTYPIGWRSASLKILGKLQLQKNDAWLPFRTFVLTKDSVYDGDHPQYPYEAVIDIIDPFSIMSPGYSYGWTKYANTQMFFKWTINELAQPVTTEMLEPDSTYK